VIGPPGDPAARAERFRAWVEAFTGSLESGRLDALDQLFAIECGYQPTPFAPTLRGRRAIREHLAAGWGALPGLSTRAEILGVGATYGIAHWRLRWEGDERVRAGEADGVLLVALDAMGRCTAVREWSLGRGDVAGVPPALTEEA
jgi:hypothetical protein